MRLGRIIGRWALFSFFAQFCFDNEANWAPKYIYFDIAFGKENPGDSRLDYEQVMRGWRSQR